MYISLDCLFVFLLYWNISYMKAASPFVLPRALPSLMHIGYFRMFELMSKQMMNKGVNALTLIRD